ncbi:MAG: EamA family transporter, partial [Gammaproteobacteria bacterium]
MSSIDSTTAPEPGLLNPRVLAPFLIVSMIWGSTWFVIRDQLAIVPAAWSVTYRFGVAAFGMFLLTAIMRHPLRIDRSMMLWTMLLGLLQFSLNFNFVYAAEHH